MTPALIRVHNFKPAELSTSTFTREAETMHVQSALYSRSIIAVSSRSDSDSGGVDKNTIIFIVVGVVCLLMILTGFYFVSRPRSACNAPSSPPQHSPSTLPPRPRRECDMRKIWKIWRHSDTNLPTTVTSTEVPTSQVSPVPVMITSPSWIISDGGGTETGPPAVSRPSPPRRVTSLSVATSFSHSHITEEDLNNFRLSAYDLDGDLEAEMLNSATDDVWPGRILAVEGEYGGMGVGVAKAIEARSDATHVAEGSAEGYVPPIDHAMKGW